MLCWVSLSGLDQVGFWSINLLNCLRHLVKLLNRLSAADQVGQKSRLPQVTNCPNPRLQLSKESFRQRMSVWQPELVVGIDGKYFGSWTPSHTVSDSMFWVRHYDQSQIISSESDIKIWVRHQDPSQTLQSKSDISSRVKHFHQSQTLQSESNTTIRVRH